MIISEETYSKIYNHLYAAGIIGKCEPYPYGVSSFYRYHCERKSSSPEVRRGYGFGSSINEIEAKFYAMAEAIERYCTLKEKKEEYIRGSYLDLKPNAVDPLLFLSFTDKQLKNAKFERFRFDENTIFNWIPVKSLFDDSEYLIPAQLIYANYDHDKWKEPVIRFPTSTGAACGSTVQNAITTGLREVIERDNYLINLWNGLAPSQINLSEIESVRELLNEIKQKGIEVYCLDLSLDFIEIVAGIFLVDRSGNGPALCVGLSCGEDMEDEIGNALREAYSVYLSRKTLFFEAKNSKFPANTESEWAAFKNVSNWNSSEYLEKIKYFLKGPIKSLKEKTIYEESDIKTLKRKGYHGFYVDISDENVRNAGLCVVKVIVPELLATSNFEEFPYKRNRRIYDVPVEQGLRKKEINEDEVVGLNPLA